MILILKIFEPESKIVYGEYNDVSSGIGHIENVWSGAYKVYNLQGMPVDGVYTEEVCISSLRTLYSQRSKDCDPISKQKQITAAGFR